MLEEMGDGTLKTKEAKIKHQRISEPKAFSGWVAVKSCRSRLPTAIMYPKSILHLGYCLESSEFNYGFYEEGT